MCEQCCVAALQFGKVLPGWYLIRARRKGNHMQEGDWGLVRQNDPDFIWTTKPVKDKSNPKSKAAERHDTNFYRELAKFENEFIGTLDAAAHLGMSIERKTKMKKKRRNVRLRYVHWLFNHLAERIEKSTPYTEKVVLPSYGPVNEKIWKN